MMLEDIVELTKYVLDKFIPKDLAVHSTLDVYRTYMGLKEVIEKINLVAEHYLVLDFTEPFLQNSSHGSPSEKWRMVLNQDLYTLNESVKKYLLELHRIAPNKELYGFDCSYLSKIYSSKYFYGFVRDQYDVGSINEGSYKLIFTALDTKLTDNHTPNIFKHKTFELSRYEQREKLQQELREGKAIMEKNLHDLKVYILKNYTLEDIL